MEKGQKDITVCFPFKKENVDDFKNNIKEALSNERVGHIILVGYNENETYRGISDFISTLKAEEKSRISLIIQKRLGTKRRAGKGDGMNTAIQYFVERGKEKFLHFYDADIKSFSRTWIDRVQVKLDEGYHVSRCFFPRAYTDAMVTWNITRTGFAYVWPHTILPDIEQPLGGELGFTREVAERLAKDKTVLEASDWSIDTALTVSFARYGIKLYEVYIKEGKHHKLYGKLSDLETMTVECFDFIRENKDLRINTDKMVYHKDNAVEVPQEYKTRIAFDIDGTIKEFKEGWTEKMKALLLEYFPPHINERVLKALSDGDYEFMDPVLWYDAYEIFMKYFNPNIEDWRKLLFKLWVLRVLNHAKLALKDPDASLRSLKTMIELFRTRAGVRE